MLSALVKSRVLFFVVPPNRIILSIILCVVLHPRSTLLDFFSTALASSQAVSHLIGPSNNNASQSDTAGTGKWYSGSARWWSCEDADGDWEE